MRVLYLDLDTLRPDHLGCYGYARNTSPNIDRVASEGIRFDNYYTTDAPCLPSRTALFTGEFGIHTGVVGHGGTAGDPRIQGRSRGFRSARSTTSWMNVMRNAGFRTVSISPFAERHSAWSFYAGFLEMINPGKCGTERADEIFPHAVDWLERNAEQDNWFTQINFWDPHGPYDVPMEYGNPFEKDPAPDWLTEEMLQKQRESYGPHSACEPIGYGGEKGSTPRIPETIANLEDFKKWVDGYDVGIRYMDDHIGKIIQLLKDKGVYDDTAIIISADHGENLGELNVYGDHQTADHITSRVPLIVKWPGAQAGIVDDQLHYNVDLPPTMAEMFSQKAPDVWDGQSFASTIREGTPQGRDYLVVSQCAWSCQRAVRFGPWIMIRTYHDGLKEFPRIMLFNLEEDPHETNNLADERPEIVNQGLALLDKWHAEAMTRSQSDIDPMWTVIREGGPLHTRAYLQSYCEHLKQTGRAGKAEKLLRLHKGEGTR